MNQTTDQLFARMPKILARVSRDFLDSCRSWAYWEAANGYPESSRRIDLHKSVNQHQEGHHLLEVKRLAFINTIVSLCRMMDNADESRSKDRETLQQVRLLVTRQDFDISHTAKLNNLDAQVAKKDFYLLVLLLTDGSKRRNMAQLRVKLFKLRDNWIAHSLQSPEQSAVNAFLVRDSLVFCGLCAKLSQRLLLGREWCPRDYWRHAIRDAQNFWDRHQSGY